MISRNDPDQLNLFGEDSPAEQPKKSSSQPAALGLAPVVDEVATLAHRVPDTIRLGTSSWSFPGWQGLIWDRKASPSTLAREGLRAYARHPLLRTVGIDKTFYRPAPCEEFDRLRKQVTDDFRFLVKAHDAITRRDPNPHSPTSPRLWLDCAYAIDQVIEPARSGLGETLGPILFQFSQMRIRSAKEAEAFIHELGEFLGRLPHGVLYAVEVRDRLLIRPSWSAMIANSGASHCFNAHPTQMTPLEQARIVDPAMQPAFVARWLLHSRGSYQQAIDRYEPFDRIVDDDPHCRGEFATLCAMVARAGKDAYVIVNNKAEGSAPHSVERLAHAIAALTV